LEEKGMCLVNVNLPDKPKGIRWTRQAVKQYDGDVVPGKDPFKRPIYWFTVKPLQGEEEGTTAGPLPGILFLSLRFALI
jgi:5'-nucleotidase